MTTAHQEVHAVTRRRWDDEDEEYLRTWGYMGAWFMAHDLDRTEASVRQRAASLGVSLGRKGCGHTGADTTKERCHCGAALWPIHRMTAKWNAEHAADIARQALTGEA